MNCDNEVNARGMNCPLPILRAKKALAGMESGQTLKVIATDAGSMRDFKAFCSQTGHALLEQITTDEGEFIHVLQRR